MKKNVLTIAEIGLVFGVAACAPAAEEAAAPEDVVETAEVETTDADVEPDTEADSEPGSLDHEGNPVDE